MMLCAVLVPGVVQSETDTERLDALELRVSALEAAIAGDPAPQEPQTHEVSLEAPIALGSGRTLTVTGYETGTRFRYTLSGGFGSTRTLSAKSGYRLLCLYVTVENIGADPLQAKRLLDATLFYGDEYENRAQETFFYQGSRGSYIGGLRNIDPDTTVNGCLLFAVPEEVETSRKALSVEIVYDDQTYDCELRDGGLLLESSEGDAAVF